MVEKPKRTPEPGLWLLAAATAFSFFAFLKGCAPVFYN